MNFRGEVLTCLVDVRLFAHGVDHLATMLVDSQVDLEEENQSMRSFIDWAHGIVMVARADWEEMARNLSQV